MQTLRDAIQVIFQQPSSRFIYLEHDQRHHIVCRFTSNDSTEVIVTLLEALRDNQALLAIADYRWEGASMISFGSKDDAALFYLCCPHC